MTAAGCASSSRTPAPGSAAPTRTVDIAMVDLAFAPDTRISVRRGERLKFVFHNDGNAPHEAMLGNDATQAAHDKEMTSSGGMSMHMRSEPGHVIVMPGKSAALTYTFARVGTLAIGCHYPGHYAAGMKIQINVA